MPRFEYEVEVTVKLKYSFELEDPDMEAGTTHATDLVKAEFPGWTKFRIHALHQALKNNPERQKDG